jgi:O-acetyl-ADP-ribose deacetylase (regulator of RNase III)
MMMPEIKYVKGDATRPQGEGKKIICHICNDERRWGAGFVLALSRRWEEPEAVYRKMPKERMMLGNVQIVPVENDIMVANMVAQRGIMDKDITGQIDKNAKPAIRYGALRVCLTEVNDIAYHMGATLHMPRIGTGLAGGKWEEVEKIIQSVMSVDVVVYDLK